MSYLATPTWPLRVVAVSEDCVPVARGRSAEFLHAGVTVTQVPSAAAALVAIGQESDVAAVLVPAEMSDMALDDFIEIVHAFGRTPVVVGLAPLSEPNVAASMRERGALETVVLPVTPHRLAQALKSVIVPMPAPRVYRCGELELDVDAFRVLWHGREVRLAPNTFELLQYLMAASPRVVTMQELVSEFVPAETQWRTDSIRVRIRRLREALGAAVPGAPKPVETVRKVGYRIVDPSDTTPDSAMSLTRSSTRATTSSRTLRTKTLGLPIGSASAQSM